MGLFGGGARLLRSRYRTNDLIPVLADTVAVGMVPAVYAETSDTNWLPQGYNGPAKAFELLETFQVLRVDDVMRVMRPDDMMRYIDDATNAVGARQSLVIEQRTQRKSDKAAVKAGDKKSADIMGKRDVGNIMSLQAIRAGTPLYCLVDFADDSNDAHIGLMLLSVQALVREQALGGWIRAGLGRFNADLKLTRNGLTLDIFKAGANGAVAELSDDVAPFVAAALEALAKLTAAEMMAFFMPRKAEAEAAVAA